LNKADEIICDLLTSISFGFCDRIVRNTQKFTMGKVHGSLARAGKVKGQTPKVEASEDKKKQPRGRAKKRLQYNRRYVNVVTGMGGKRVGPNSNADKMK
jgi:small subunit ribosomal protein S30e